MYHAWRKVKQRDYLIDQSIDERIILKCLKVWTDIQLTHTRLCGKDWVQ